MVTISPRPFIATGDIAETPCGLFAFREWRETPLALTAFRASQATWATRLKCQMAGVANVIVESRL